jgi:hypothetical protein
MRKYIILFFLVFLFLFSCSSTPDGIIKPDEMVGLLTDIHIADGSVSSISQAPDSLYKYATGRYSYIFKQYHTDSTQFRKSFRYYTSNPTEMAGIYDQVMKNLQSKADSINKLLTKQNTLNHGKPLLQTAQPGAPTPGGSPMMRGRPVMPLTIGERINFEKNKGKRDSLINIIKQRKHIIHEK